MANILIVGFTPSRSKSLRDQIDNIIKSHGWDGDSATVIWNAQTRWCANKKSAPYLVVRHSKGEKADLIADTLYAALNLDIEVEQLRRYLASVPQPPEK